MTKELHTPVLLNEVINLLDPKEGGVYIDATLGFGGHTLEIAKRVGQRGKVLGIDRDGEMIALARERLKDMENVTFGEGNFLDLSEIAQSQEVGQVDGILVDLGVSSLQLDKEDRGFSFRSRGPLDMRMDRSAELRASDVVNTYSQKELSQIFKSYGEEKFAARIAGQIVAARSEGEIVTTMELKDIIESALPHSYMRTLKIDPATKVFQALRIEVNGELKALEGLLPQAIRILKQGGRLAVISFHSLEDRIVKEFFRREAKGCICPSEFPVCRCGKSPELRIITRKPVTATAKEISGNPRSRSAKLRVAEKI